ncbi:aldo/keto reductase [Micromonospora sp. M12]
MGGGRPVLRHRTALRPRAVRAPPRCRLRGRPRHEYVVSTKVGRLLVPSPQDAHLRDSDGFDVPASHRREWDFSGDGVRRSIEASLDRTGLDRIDVVYLHDPDDHWEQAAREAVPALVDLRDQGVVGAIGAGMNQSAMLARFVRETDVDLMMCAGRYTLLEQGAADDLLPAAQSRGGRGDRGRLQLGAAVAGSAAGRCRLQLPAGPGRGDRAGAGIAAVCETYGVTLPQAALAFVRRHPAVVSTVVGVRNGSQMAETVRRSEAAVPEELWDALAAAGLLAALPAGDSSVQPG